MAKKQPSTPEYPSPFGSHLVMLDQLLTESLGVPGRVVVKDEHGCYETDAKRLDTGLADPNRYATSRLSQ